MNKVRCTCTSIDRIMGGICTIMSDKELVDRTDTKTMIEYGSQLYTQQGALRCDLFAVWMMKTVPDCRHNAERFICADEGERPILFGILISVAMCHYDSWIDKYVDYGFVHDGEVLPLEREAME